MQMLDSKGSTGGKEQETGWSENPPFADVEDDVPF
jgi:hypothetical protein